MTKQSRTYTSDFKREAACLVPDQGYSHIEAARSLGLVELALCRWVDQLQIIQAKTTRAALGSSFLVSHNELEFSKEACEQFYRYRVFQFRDGPHRFMLSGDLSQHVHLKATDYRASFRGITG